MAERWSGYQETNDTCLREPAHAHALPSPRALILPNSGAVAEASLYGTCRKDAVKRAVAYRATGLSVSAAKVSSAAICLAYRNLQSAFPPESAWSLGKTELHPLVCGSADRTQKVQTGWIRILFLPLSLSPSLLLTFFGSVDYSLIILYS